MSDKKISQLTAATTPLAGTEVVPIVQSGTTKQVAISDLTAGRTVAASEVDVGNLVLSGNTIASSSGTVTAQPVSGQKVILNPTVSGIGTVINNQHATVGAVVQLSSASASGNGWRLIDGYADINGTPKSIFWVRGDGVIAPYENIVFQAADKGIYDSTTAVSLLMKSTGVTLGGGNLVIGTAGKGIDFSATAGTGTSELLADYEEGTWTPVLTGSSSNPTVTYAAQRGLYTKIGRLVTIECNVSWSAFSGGSGDLRVSGLPFAFESAVNVYGAGPIGYQSGLTFPSSRTFASMQGVPATTYVRVASSGSAVATVMLQISAAASAGDLVFTYSYSV